MLRHYDDLPTPATADELRAAGYKRISNRYRIVSRVDADDDTLRRLFRQYGPRIDDAAPLTEDLRDFYRRVHSKDQIEGVPRDVFRQLPPAR